MGKKQYIWGSVLSLFSGTTGGLGMYFPQMGGDTVYFLLTSVNNVLGSDIAVDDTFV